MQKCVFYLYTIFLSGFEGLICHMTSGLKFLRLSNMNNLVFKVLNLNQKAHYNLASEICMENNNLNSKGLI